MSEDIGLPEAPVTEAPAQASQENIDELYAGVEFKEGAPPAETEGEAPKEEAPAEPEEIKYEWEAPAEFKEKYLSSEEGQKEYTEFQDFAKQNGIKPEAFNALMEKYSTNIAKLQEGMTGNLVKEWEETKKGWHQAILKDTEVGGKNYASARESAKLALSELGTPALAKELEQTGFGHNPEVFKFIFRVGKAIGEGSFVRGKPVPPEPKQPWEKIYKS